MLQLSFVKFNRGSYITVEGKDEHDKFYIIQQGNVKCQSSDGVTTSLKPVLGPGDFVGVIPCMSDHSQIETAIAATDVVAISVKKSQYSELIKKNTQVAMKIIRAFAKNMREMNERLTQLTLNNVVEETPEQIFDVAAFYDKINKPSIASFAYYQYVKACPTGANVAQAKTRFVKLRPNSKAVYFEQVPDLLRIYPRDTMVMAECQRGAEMYIIQDGKVKISKVVNGEEVILAVLKKGDMFGEMALLENKPRSASAIAEEESRLMTVNRQNFDQMVATQSQLVARLTTMLAERLWSMRRQLANALIKDPGHKMMDMLGLQIEKARVVLSAEKDYVTDLTLEDLVTMCGLSKEEKYKGMIGFQSDPNITLVRGKITVKKCSELIKTIEFQRRQRSKAMNKKT